MLAREYLGRVRDELGHRKRYPFGAQRMGISGAVKVSFIIGPAGRFSDILVKQSSGHDILDQAAIKTVASLSGELLRPRALGDTPLRATVFLRYHLN